MRDQLQKEVDRAALFNGGPIEVPACWSLDVWNDFVDLRTPGAAPDQYDEARDELFPGGLMFNLNPRYDRADLVAEQIVAGFAVGAFHEGLECVKVSGRRLAEPHPKFEGEMWDWLMSEMHSLVRRYRKRWPTP